ncbi:MAG: hypothetical protein KKD08_08510 [Alphaproteobacteria bacterium]|nr:hypothetical protein [Alphaproteobacteria bacterium]
MDLVWFESIKLLAQLGGALIVARLAVGWALKRYKSEKLWERRLTAFTDVVTALSEMRRLYSIWEREIIYARRSSPERDDEHNRRYREAQDRLNETIAIGRLVLPVPTQNSLAKFQLTVANLQAFDTQLEMIEFMMGAIGETLETTIEQGREYLSTDLGDQGG